MSLPVVQTSVYLCPVELEFMQGSRAHPINLLLELRGRQSLWIVQSTIFLMFLLMYLKTLDMEGIRSWRVHLLSQLMRVNLEKAVMEKAKGKMPPDFGSEEMLGLVEGSFYNPLDVPESAGHGGNPVVDGSPSNPVDDSTSLEKAAMENTQEKMPMLKKRRSLPQSPGRISEKKMKQIHQAEREITRKMTTTTKELQAVRRGC